jgi:hypothetical protein
MQPAPIEPGKPFKEAARRRPGILFFLLGAFLAAVEVFLVRGARYDWALKLAIVVLGTALGGVLRKKLGIEEEETEEEGKP